MTLNSSVDHTLKSTEKDKANFNKMIPQKMSTSSLTSTTPSKPSNNGNKENDIITLTEK